MDTHSDDRSHIGHGITPSTPRDERGRVLPGHQLPATHYLNAQRVPQVYLDAERDLLAQSIADDGGVENIPARRLAQHEYRCSIHRKVWQLSDALDAKGLFDSRSKLRERWLARYEALVALATRIDSTLGLERRTRQVPNPADWLEGKA